MNDLGEIFCEAVDTIIKERIAEISFDKTVLCEIIDDSRRDKGQYIVIMNDTAKFEAYSTDTSYRNRQAVYVQIPGGDWNQQRIIIGRKVDDNVEPYVYNRPFSRLIDVSGNLLGDGSVFAADGLLANSPDKEYINLWTYNIPEEESKIKDFGDSFSGFTRLGIQAGFKATLNPFYDENGVQKLVSQGEYGLRLLVYIEEEITADGKEPEPYVITLNQEDMNGSPYEFNTFFSQEKVMDVSSISKIKAMKLQFYQKAGSFKDKNGMLLPHTGFLNKPLSPNLFVNNIKLSLGYDTEAFNKEKIEIYSADSLTYSGLVKDNVKSIHARWIHRQNDNSFISVAERDNINFEIRWYRYKLGEAGADQYSGVYWTALATQVFDETGLSFKIQDKDWLAHNEANKNDERFPDFLSAYLFPNFNQSTERVKAVLLYNNEVFYSNILEFTNQNEILNTPTIEAVQALSLKCDDNTHGNYRLYGSTGMLIDIAQSHQVRTITPYFLPHSQNDASMADILIDAEQIEWVVPGTNTMIVMDENARSGTQLSEDGFYHIMRRGETVGSIEGVNTLQYRINAYYTQFYNNNTITCKVTKGGIIYTATKTLTFGEAGTSGSKASLVLSFQNNVNAVTLGSNTATIVAAKLYDFENNEIDISQYKVSWSWKTKNSDLVELIGESSQKDLMYIASDTTKPYCEIKPMTDATMKPNYHVLQAVIEDWDPYRLIAYLPIPIRETEKYSYIGGMTRITYSSSGELIDYFNNPYILYDRYGNKVLDEKGEELDWTSGGVKTRDDGALLDDTFFYLHNPISEEKPYTPIIYKSQIHIPVKDENGTIIDSKDGGIQYVLQPIKIYVEDSCQYLCVTAKDSIENKILWSQPVLITQDKYTISTLSEWDGSLIVDKEENSIQSASVVAGKKEDDNTFTGIILGDYKDKSNLLNTGLYGFKNGVQTFGFKDDGTAFIGGNNSRLLFDGTESTIKSNSYENKGGMLLDFDDGFIKIKYPGATLQEKGITLTANTKDDYPLSIGKNFRVAWDGTLNAEKGVFKGEINATSGAISGDLIVTGNLICKGKTDGNKDITYWNIDEEGKIVFSGGTIGSCIVESNCIKSASAGWKLFSNGDLDLDFKSGFKIQGKSPITNAAITVKNAQAEDAKQDISLTFAHGVMMSAGASNFTIIGLPPGGTAGQILKINDDGNPVWVNP